MTALPIGKAVTIASGHKVAILNFGVLLEEAEAAATELGATLVDMRWVKPSMKRCCWNWPAPTSALLPLKKTCWPGARSAVAEFLANAGVQVQMRHIAIPMVLSITVASNRTARPQGSPGPPSWKLAP